MAAFGISFKSKRQEGKKTGELDNVCMMKLGDNVVKNFKVAKVFREFHQEINAFDFSPSGELVIACSDDDQIVLYDCNKGAIAKTVYSKKYGADLIHFVGNKNSALHSSTKVDDTIRYLSLQDNKYIRYFTGHDKRVVTLSVAHHDEKFLTGSLDKTIRIWDLRSPNCHGLLNLDGKPLASFDPLGLVFAVAVDSDYISLYDMRSFDKGPFGMYETRDCNLDYTAMKFSANGKMILLSTNRNIIRVMDAFKGSFLHTFDDYHNDEGIPIEASFSPDSQYIFSGSTDARVHVWHARSGRKITTLKGDHHNAITHVRFNPKYMMLATACENLAFWIPPEHC